MKLIILLAALAYSTSVVSPGCCPCSGPEKPDYIQFVVEIPESPKSNPSSVVPELLNLLVNSRFIDYPTATSILVTFRIPVPSNFPQKGNPITKTTINTLPVKGNPDVRNKFIKQLTDLLDKPSHPRLVKTLLELILNNKVATVPQVLIITVEYNVVPNIDIVVQPERVPKPQTTPRHQQQTTPAQPQKTTPAQPQKSTPAQPQKTTPSYQQLTTPNVPIKPGKPTDSTVTITVNISPSDASPLVKYLIELLVKNKIVDKPTAERIVVTFIPNTGLPAKPFNPNEPITNVGGDPKPSKKFIEYIINLIRNPKSPDAPSKLVKIFLEVLIDNGVIDLPTATTITIRFNVPIRVTTTSEQPKPVDKVPSIDEITSILVPGKPSDSTITFTQVLHPENLPTFVNRLLQILVTRKVIDAPTANRILVTFHIPGAPDSPFKPDTAKPLNPNDVTTVTINGEPSPKDKFIKAIVNLIRNPSPQGKKPAEPLTKILLEFVVDNGIVDSPTVLKILVKFGVGAQIQIQPVQKATPSYQELTTPNVPIKPGKPTDSTVTITTNISPSDASPLVKYLIDLLVRNKIVDKPTAERIIVTFIPNTGLPAKPLNPNEPIKTIGGDPKPSKKFIDYIINLIRNPKSPDAPSKLVKIFLEVLIDNGVIDLPTATTITIRFNVPIRVTTTSEQPKPVNKLPSIDEITTTLVPGKPSDSTITINQVLHPENLPTFVNRLLQILVTRKIIDTPTANRILVTFRIPGAPDSPFKPDSAKPLNPNDITTVVINGEPFPKEKFIKSIINFLKNPSSQGKEPAQPLVKTLLEFIIDNGIIDSETALKTLAKFGLGGKILIQSIQQSPVDKLPSIDEITKTLVPGKPSDSTITITEVLYPESLPIFVNRLLQILVTRKIIDTPTANRVLVTFRIPGAPDSPFKPDGAKPFSPSDVDTVVINGEPFPKEKLIKSFITLFQNPSPQGKGPAQSLVKILLEFIVDNGITDSQTALQILVKFGLGAKFQIKDAPTYKPYQGTITPGQPGVSTVTITQISEDDVPEAVNGLLEILVSQNIIDAPTANSFLITFKLPGRGRFNPTGAQPLSPSSVSSIRINVNDAPAKKRFIDSLTSLVNKPVPSSLVQVFLTVLLDSGTIDLQTAKSIMTIFRIGASINFSFTPKAQPVKEPALTPDPDRGADTQTDSTVTVKQVVGDLKPFIVRLVQLSVQGNLFPQSVGANILTTFNVQPGGSSLSATSVSALPVRGKDKGVKFTKNLSALVSSAGSSSSLNGLVKVLMELLIDNNVFGLRSASGLFQAYNVGASINVQYRSVQVG